MQSLFPNSAEAVANNEDVLTQILLCLPVRYLLRFKCVSKHWLSLITNPKFCDRHTLQNPNPKISGFFSKMSIPDFCCISLPNNENPCGCPPEPLNFIQDPEGIEILDSCNGLLLCGSCSERGTTRKYYVVNPTTNKFLTLPATITSTYICSVTLAFDPSKSLHYKVICFQSSDALIDYPRLQVEVEIYSSETRSWRHAKSTFRDSFGINFSDGVYCNGAIHWINSSGTLLHYDIDEEHFGVVVSSSPSYNYGEGRYFGKSHGRLYRVENYRPDVTEFVVLEMGMDYSGWSVKYHVDLHPIISEFPEIMEDYFCDPGDWDSYSFVVLSVAREENEEDLSLLVHIPCNKVVSYNLKDRTFKKLCDLTPKGTLTETDLQVGWYSTYQYMETLACV